MLLLLSEHTRCELTLLLFGVSLLYIVELVLLPIKLTGNAQQLIVFILLIRLHCLFNQLTFDLDFCMCILYMYAYIVCLQCFDAVGWVAGRASGL